MRQMWRTKPLPADPHATDHGLHRCLGPLDLVLLGIGAIIGTGIFVLTGKAAANLAGPGVVLSFVIAGIACGLAAFAYAELAATVGGCGSAYGYSYAVFGEFFAWLVGWGLLLEYGMAVAAVANGWSAYLQGLLAGLGWPLPPALTRGPYADGLFNVPAAAIVLALMLLLIAGVRESARLNAIAVAIKLVTIALFLVVAVFHVDPANWTDFLPYGWYGTGSSGEPVGVLAGAALVFFAYVGFDAVSTAAEEARDPARDLPIGIVGSLLFCTVIYVAVAALLTLIVPYTELGVANPVAFGLERAGVRAGSALVSVGAIAGLTTVMLVLYYGLTRVIYAMARDGLLPRGLAEVNEHTRTPVTVIVATGLLMAGMAGMVPLGKLAELVNIGTLAAFVMVCLGVVVLRHTHPEQARPFRAPFGLLLPIAGALACAGLMAFLSAATWLRFGYWLLAGLLIYACYGVHHSSLRQQQG
ncbi:MAG TPA: amino acid permease [Gammaproteobacteria bacterium]|nr:amino acid permease [Gammaproteobacteria bacterium]